MTLFRLEREDGSHYLTDRITHMWGSNRPGGALIMAGTWLLAGTAAALFAVSMDAQFRYILSVKRSAAPSLLEAFGPDLLMAIFSLLALGLARAGQQARIERILIVVCAMVSAVMNYAAADVTSPRSVLVYVLPPLLLAVAVDRVIAVVRRHVVGADDHAAWAVLGMAVLYLLRFMVSAPSTASGVRRWIIDSAPLPSAETQTETKELLPPATKKDRLLSLYRDHPEYGDRSAASKVAAELAPQADMPASSARKWIAQELAS